MNGLTSGEILPNSIFGEWQTQTDVSVLVPRMSCKSTSRPTVKTLVKNHSRVTHDQKSYEDRDNVIVSHLHDGNKRRIISNTEPAYICF